jgi:hypothetical protein
MRAIAMGLLAGGWVTWVLLGTSPEPANVFAQRFDEIDRAVSQRSDLIAIPGSDAGGQQLLLLIDPQRRILGSYHVDATTGQIALRSVRNIRWDLELDEFNGTEPSPEKIQALLRSR